jgi:hypothetical protein
LSPARYVVMANKSIINSIDTFIDKIIGLK